MMEEIRSAASFEGLAVLAVIYFALSALSKAGRKRGGQAPPPPRPAAGSGTTGTQQEGLSLESVLRQIERVKREAETRTARPEPPDVRPRLSNPAPKPKPAGQRPRALPSVERQGRMASAQTDQRPRALPSAERQGRMARAQTEAGPLGRHSQTRLPSSEEFEERTSLEEGGSLEGAGRLEVLDEARLRTRQVEDQDEGAEAVVQRRIQEAEARNREFSEADHTKFHQRIQQAEAAPVASRKRSIAQLREAFIWREILGPPKSLE